MVTHYRWTVAYCLSFFFGWLGIDRFYMGKIRSGLLKLFTLGGMGIWWLIDLFLIVTSYKFKEVHWIEPKRKIMHVFIPLMLAIVLVIVIEAIYWI